MDIERGEIYSQCFICGEEIKQDDDIVLLNCGHIVHAEHWAMWNKSLMPYMQNYCRICRKVVSVRGEPSGCCTLFERWCLYLQRNFKKACVRDDFEYQHSYMSK